MQNKEEVKSFIWGVVDVLRNAMLFRELEYSAVRLVFIKYAVDNYIGAQTREDMQACARAQKMFAMRDIEYGMEYINPVLEYIDRAYNLERILSSNEVEQAYLNELFGNANNAQKKSASTEDYIGILRYLSSVDLEERPDDTSLGSLLVESLMDVIVSNSYRNGYASDHTTKPQLNELVSRILDVQPEDCYCDFASGIGLSTLQIVKDRKVRVFNADVNTLAVSTSAMLLIMSGYTDFDIKSEDTFINPLNDFKGNKLFVDGPWAMRMKTIPGINDYADSTFAIIDKTVNWYMDESEDSISVITLPSGALFKSNKQATILRSQLLNKGLVNAVITLPALKQGTSIPLNLMILTRKKNDHILFVNAKDSVTQSSKRNDILGDVALPDDLLDTIMDTLNTNKEIPGFSKYVSYEEVENQNYNFTPTVYISPVIEEDETTLEEINSQLDDLYKQLLK